MATVKAFAFSNSVPELPHHDYGMFSTSDGRGKDILICDSDSVKTPLYLARVSRTGNSKKKPHLTLYSARHVSMDPEVVANGTKLKSKQAKAGDVVGVAYFPAWSKKIQIGVGNSRVPDGIRWETISAPKIGVHEFALATTPPSGNYTNTFSASFENMQEATQDPVKCQWRHTQRTAEVLGKTMRVRKKLVDTHGRVIALFIPGGWKGLSMLGTLRIVRDEVGSAVNTITAIDRDAEIKIILSRCAIVAKLRK